MKNIVRILKILIIEIFPDLILERVNYTLKGSCNMCGDCCRYLLTLGEFTEQEFRFLTLLYPKYKRFKVIGRDEKDNLILACNLIGEDGMCPDYKNRPKICRDYPNPGKIYSGGKLYKRCSYKLIPEKSFQSYLN